MKTLRPIAFVLAILMLISVSAVSTWAQDDPALDPGAGGQISGNLPDSRAGIITLEGLSGTNGMAVGAVPQGGISAFQGDQYWDGNFYRLDAFLPYNLTPGTDYFYSILSGAMTQRGDGVFNLGLGYGYYADSWDRLFRTTAWLDVDGGPSKALVALGAQTESLGKFIDTRAGVQIVASDSTNTVFNGLTGAPIFIGNNLLRNGRVTKETAFNQANLEVGGPVAWLGDYGISMYGQGYFLTNFSEDRRSLGVGVRGEWTITEDVTLNANYTHDDLFGSNTYLSIALTTPDGAPQHVARPIPVRERFSKRPYRTGRIANLRETSNVAIKATDAKTGNPLFIVYVDPNAVAPGIGTIESPYNTLEAARLANNSNVSVFYVDPNTTDPNLNTNGLQVTDSFELLDFQYFLSSTVDQTISTGNFGDVILAGSGLANPLISNGDNTMSSSVITLANWNVVSGFTIDGRNIDGDVAHAGITGAGISGFEITRNNFQNVALGTIISHIGTDRGIFDDNVVTGSGFGSFRGFSLTHTGGTLDLSVQRNTVTNVLGEDLDIDGMLDIGEDILPNGVLDPGIGIEIIANGGTINAWDPLVLGQPVPVPPAVLPAKLYGILDNVSTGNGTGFVLQANNGAVINADIQGNDFSNNVNPNTGARLEAFSGTLNLLAFNGNMINDNVGNGLVIHADDTGGGSGTINIFDMNNNTITGNGVNTIENLLGTNNNGIYLLADNSSTIDASTMLAGLGFVGLGLTDNNISDNLGAGFLADVDHTSNLSLDFEVGDVGNVVDNNDRDGLFYRLNHGSSLTTNLLNSSFSNNGGFGIGSLMQNGSSGMMNIGSLVVGTSNAINNNTGAGIGLTVASGSVLTTNILGNFVQSNNDDNDALTPFAGDGIAIIVDNGTLVNSVIDLNAIGDLMTAGLGNDGHGILVSTTGSSASGINNLRIGNTDGDNDNGNQIGNNGIDGIHIERSATSFVTNVLIEDNKIWNNTDDGIEIIGRNSTFDLLDYDINDNWIFNNGDDGVALQVTVNAQMDVDMLNNLIDSNDGDGIFTSEMANTNTDTKRLTGFWRFNTIVNNDGNGININTGRHRLFTPTLDIEADDNLIDSNGLDGVVVNSNGVFRFERNLISRNGENGMSLINSGFKRVFLVSNMFVMNEEDGLEINNNDQSFSPPASPLGFDIDSTNDQFISNVGRGIDILNQGDANSDIEFDGAIVRDNGLEGVYVVNTASTTQNQDDPATMALASDGTSGAPFLDFIFRNGTVIGNGNNSGFDGTGLVIRVGTAGSGGGFADMFAGVEALITGNTFGGNNGDDVLFEPFISAAPGGGTTDPLSRFDLVFTNNTGDSYDVSRGGAFYNNADGTKSPWDDTRRRNAMRAAGGPFDFASVIAAVFDADEFDGPGSLPNVNDRFNTLMLTFTSGAQNGMNFTITDYIGATRRFMIASTAGLNPGDTFDIHFTGNYPGLGNSTWRVQQFGNTFTGPNSSLFTDTTPLGNPALGEFDFYWDTTFVPPPGFP